MADATPQIYEYIKQHTRNQSVPPGIKINHKVLSLHFPLPEESHQWLESHIIKTEIPCLYDTNSNINNLPLPMGPTTNSRCLQQVEIYLKSPPGLSISTRRSFYKLIPRLIFDEVLQMYFNSIWQLPTHQLTQVSKSTSPQLVPHLPIGDLPTSLWWTYIYIYVISDTIHSIPICAKISYLTLVQWKCDCFWY